MQVLVTGGAGFIGSNLVDRLLGDGHRVSVADDLSSGSLANLESAESYGEAYDFAQVDVRDVDLIAYVMRKEPEVIYHLAAQPSVAMSVAQPRFDADVNILGSLRVLDAAREAGTRKVVFAASGGTMYGSVPAERLPLDESRPRAPFSPYGVAKCAVIEYLAAYRELYGLDYTALALSNVYGPRQDPFGEAGVVAIFADNVWTGRPSVINGDGEQTRDFVFVSDVVDAFVRAARRGSEMVLNVGSGKRTSINRLFRALLEVAETDAPLQYGPPRPGEVRHCALDPTLAKSVLGWLPTVALESGLAATFAHTCARHESLAGT